MQIFVRLPDSTQFSLDCDSSDYVQWIADAIGEQVSTEIQNNMYLTYGGRCLEAWNELGESGIESLATLDVQIPVLGGTMEPTLKALARKYNQDKKICRKCYARLPPKAHNCRKRKCGHSNHLRAKKMSKKD